MRTALAPLIAATAVLAAALWVRVGGGWAVLDMTWDSQIYMTVADNIRLRGCVSVIAGECRPHWGGNQLPGYPFFLAALRSGLEWFGSVERSWLAPGLAKPIVLVQGLLFAAAAAYLAHAVARLRGPWVGALAGLVVAISPATLAWSRFLLTESLAAAAAVLVAAELVLSVAAGRVRWLPLALWLSVAFFLRYDSIFLVVPVAVVAVALHGVRRGAVVLALVGAVVAVPLGAWWARSIAAGLPPTPPGLAAPHDWRPPVGAWRWARTWVVDEVDHMLFTNNVLIGEYRKVQLFSHYFEPAERDRVIALLDRLQPYQGREMPAEIDAEFGALADARLDRDWLAVQVVQPLKRALSLWRDGRTNALNWGWPRRPPYLEWGEAAAVYRMLLALGTVTLLVAAWQLLRREERAIAGAAVAAGMAKTAMLGALGAAEQRYLVETLPFLELAAVLMTTAVAGRFLERFRRRAPVA